MRYNKVQAIPTLIFPSPLICFPLVDCLVARRAYVPSSSPRLPRSRNLGSSLTFATFADPVLAAYSFYCHCVVLVKGDMADQLHPILIL